MQVLKRSLHFNSIIVIQRLHWDNGATGRELFENAIEPAVKQSGPDAQFVKFDAGRDLLPLLDEIALTCEHHGLRPHHPS